MKEYLIAFRYKRVFDGWEWATIVKHCKMTGANLKNIEDESRETMRTDVVRIMTFSELEQSDD